MSSSFASDKPSAYAIQVRGRLDERWSSWFDGMEIVFENGFTTLTGTVVDQAALHGVLDRIWSLNLALVSVSPIKVDERDGTGGRCEGRSPNV